MGRVDKPHYLHLVQLLVQGRALLRTRLLPNRTLGVCTDLGPDPYQSPCRGAPGRAVGRLLNVVCVCPCVCSCTYVCMCLSVCACVYTRVHGISRDMTASPASCFSAECERLSPVSTGSTRPTGTRPGSPRKSHLSPSQVLAAPPSARSQ